MMINQSHFLGFMQGLAYLTSTISQEYIDKSLLHLLESAKLDPSQPEIFRVLGDYYRNQPNGAKRAMRCYQKAVLLNCEDADAGVSRISHFVY
jgi:cytochrome c-type biogenesis protein CcmH/NrfG